MQHKYKVHYKRMWQLSECVSNKDFLMYIYQRKEKEGELKYGGREQNCIEVTPNWGQEKLDYFAT